MTRPGSFPWLARHELRLSWRDWSALATGGNRNRALVVAVVMVVIAVAMHLLAYHLIGAHAPSGVNPERAVLILVTGSALLTCP